MDAFFVSCERTVRKDLQNIPVAVARNSKRAIATALSQEAKQLGAKVGSPIFLIKEFIPNIKIVQPNLELYTLISIRIFNFISREYLVDVEPYSIDECYVDFTKYIKNRNIDPELLAWEIRDKIKNNLSIPCSIGIGHNKFIAKMSTNIAKPTGVKWTKPSDIERHFYDLPIEKFFGIGKGYAPKLKEIGILTVGDFANYKNTFLLQKIMGKNFYLKQQQIKGITVDKLEKNHDSVKGVGNSLTFMEGDIVEEPRLLNELKRLCDKISQRMSRRHISGKVVVLEIRNLEKQWNTYQTSLEKYINKKEDIYQAIMELFWHNWDRNPLRGVGVRITSLISNNQKNNYIDIFSKPKNVIDEIESSVNEVFDKKVIYKASSLENKTNQKRVHSNRFNIEDYDNSLFKKINITKE
ncbi:Y-family DNA polymerase [Mycoplasma phocoenae]|uniref:DNA polymerase IV n=1 Tax=Mycoplasma phocoenae TaxID=754517 RepID=A0A858U522_9MOLU|nr:DNA polymerase IV [Mycoplasma phocoenae]QJG67151.1 DNA polymerase IV [Mycoplasma phocoenae]